MRSPKTESNPVNTFVDTCICSTHLFVSCVYAWENSSLFTDWLIKLIQIWKQRFLFLDKFGKLESEVQHLREVNTKLRAANKKLRLRVQTSSRVLSSQRKQLRFLSSKSYQTEIIRKKLLTKFSSAQTSILLNNRKRARQWSQQDIANALVLRACSKKSYIFLRKKKLLPLPGLTIFEC